MTQIFMGAALAAALLVAGCAAQPEKPGATSTIMLSLDENGKIEPSAEQREVEAGIRMLMDGDVMEAMEGPLAEVIRWHEDKYATSNEKIYCATTMVEAVLYAARGAPDAKEFTSAKPTLVLDRSWAMAHWARGYGFIELDRPEQARAEIKKALELSPLDAQYKSELAFMYQRDHNYSKSLELYREAQQNAQFSVDESNRPTMQCLALRGQGYALVELHRYDEAVKAYNACLKLIPDEPKSKGELEYIEQVRSSQPR